MKAEWLKLAARFDALQVRERWLVAAALLGGLLLISYHFFLDPALAKAKQAEQQIVQSRSQITTLGDQIALLQAPGHDPDTAARAELAQLKKQMSEFAAEFKELEDSLVPPGKTAELLEDMVGQKSSLRLISLKTLPASPLLEKKAEVDEHGVAKTTEKPAENRVVNVGSPAAKGPQADAPGLFKHGVEVRLEGSYADLAAYLQRLEAANLKLLWSSVNLSADKHPKLELTLIVYTLSLDRAWLIV